ncbi:MAG: Rnase Y domain-containing protein [Paramuribaculum sp.]|nr:Rnase Y domain-containing protein [Paramuribaculum sp.]
MTSILIYVIVAVAALAIGAVVTTLISRNMAHSRANIIIDEAKKEAELIKQNKLLEARNEQRDIIAEAEKQANQRMQKIQSAESRVKQRELQLNQQQSENQRAKNDNEQTKAKLEEQLALADTRQAELESLKRKVQEELEHVSGLSSEEAREKLVESLKDEAKTAAQSYINAVS